MVANESHSLAPGKNGTTAEHPTHTTDFGFIPMPRRLRYDPHNPFHFNLLLNIAFGLASTFSEFSLWRT